MSLPGTKGFAENRPARGGNPGDILSFDGNGKLQTAAASSNKFIVGICTEAKDSSGMIEFFLNIGALA